METKACFAIRSVWPWYLQWQFLKYTVLAFQVKKNLITFNTKAIFDPLKSKLKSQQYFCYVKKHMVNIVKTELGIIPFAFRNATIAIVKCDKVKKRTGSR